MKRRSVMLIAVLAGCSPGADTGAVEGAQATAALQDVIGRRAERPAGEVVDALVLVSEAPDPAAVPFVVSLVDDAEEEVRWHVVVALKAIGGPEAKRVLAGMAATDASEMVRDEAQMP